MKNDDGSLLLAPYEGAFEGTPLSIGIPTSITPLTTTPLLESIYVALPVLTNPYDSSSAPVAGVTLNKLIPWLPQGDGVGFPIAINGAQDYFEETAPGLLPASLLARTADSTTCR